MSSKTIRIAVIGAGNMGRNHIRTYSKMNGVEIVAITDKNPNAAEVAKEYGVPFYSDHLELLDTKKIDAVSIVTPTPFHHKIGKDCISRGIHCIIEKPIATTLEEADELMKLADSQGVVLTIGHIERYNPMIQKLKKLIGNKEIGDITSIITRRVGGFPAMEPKTDVIIDLAVHDIEIISYLLGRQPESMNGHGSRTLHGSEIDSAELFLNYGAASGFIQANWVTPVKVRNIAVTGTKGYIEGNYITQELTYYKHSMHRKSDGFKNFVSSFGEPERYYISEDPKEPLAIELQTFIDKINGSPVEVVTPTEARQALAVALEVINKTRITDRPKPTTANRKKKGTV